MSNVVMFLEKYIGAWLVLLWSFTIRFRVRKGSYYPEPAIYSFWHRNQVALLMFHRYRQAGVLISASKDGELIAGPAKVLGYQPIRGSSSQGGGRALVEMIHYGKEHSLSVTPDGPKGPPQEVKEGVLVLALKTGQPIIPVGLYLSRGKVFPSWDRFKIPYPFSKADVYYGEPIWVRSKAEMEAAGQELKRQLDRIPGAYDFVNEQEAVLK